MAIKDLTVLRTELNAQSQKTAEESITPSDVFGNGGVDVVDSLEAKIDNATLSLEQAKQDVLRGSVNGNITIDQSEKRVNLSEQLTAISRIMGKTGQTSTSFFCDDVIARNPEMRISKDLIELFSLALDIRINGYSRLKLDATTTRISSPAGQVVLDATTNDVMLGDGSGAPVITRDNGGVFSIFRKMGGSLNPVANVTPTATTFFDHENNPLLQVSTTQNGNDFFLFREDGTKAVIRYSSSTNTLTLFGNDSGGAPRKLIEATPTSTTYYGLTDNEYMIKHEIVNGASGYQINKRLAYATVSKVIFKGTTAQWNALAQSEKDEYYTAILVD